MKRPALKLLLPALGVAALAAIGARILLQVDVHEWGILVDQDSTASAFQDAATFRVPTALQRPSSRCDSMWAVSMPDLGAMESRIPVLTFRSRLPLPMTVRVRFPKGSPAQSFPEAKREGEALTWKVRLGSPSGSRELRVPDSLRFLLDSEVSTLAASTGEVAPFLFYEGRLPAGGKLEVRPAGGDSLRVTNRTGHRIHDVHVSRTLRDSAVSGGVALLEAGESVTLGRSDAPDPRLTGLRGGLSETEARAFAQAFDANAAERGPGQLRWSYRLEQGTVDRLLPLELSWPFAKVRRVFVVTHAENILDAQGCPEGMLSEPSNESIIDAILAGGGTPAKSGRLRRPVPPPMRGELP